MDGALININSVTSSVNLASLSTTLYGSVLPYTIVNVNANVIGNNGSNGSNSTQSQEHCIRYQGCSSSFKNGTSGSTPFNFSGYSGYTVKIINNSTIKGGSGGNGGNASSGYDACLGGYTTYGGSGGAGAYWKTNESGVTLELQGNPPTSGTNGTGGSNGYISSGQCGD